MMSDDDYTRNMRREMGGWMESFLGCFGGPEKKGVLISCLLELEGLVSSSRFI